MHAAAFRRSRDSVTLCALVQSELLPNPGSGLVVEELEQESENNDAEESTDIGGNWQGFEPQELSLYDLGASVVPEDSCGYQPKHSMCKAYVFGHEGEQKCPSKCRNHRFCVYASGKPCTTKNS